MKAAEKQKMERTYAANLKLMQKQLEDYSKGFVQR